MCGRYTLVSPEDDLVRQFSFDTGPIEFRPRYNIAPSQEVLTVLDDGGTRRGKMLRWGLVPSWAKDIKIGYKTINARADTVATAGAFRTPFKKRRCLVLADGFYEWKRVGKGKQPMHIRLRGGEPFAFAGLWDAWKNPADGQWIHSCTIVTTTPNELIAPIHDRMPVILSSEAERMWLDATVLDQKTLLSLLTPFPAGSMEVRPVSTLVNSVKNDGPELVKQAPKGD